MSLKSPRIDAISPRSSLDPDRASPVSPVSSRGVASAGGLRRWRASTMALVLPSCLLSLTACSPLTLLQEDRLINADLFSDKPEILSAGYGFEGIIGVDGDEAEVRAAGGTWNKVTCSNGKDPSRRVLTSSPEPGPIMNTRNGDALPVVFSWPFLPSTLAPSDFRLTLNDGTKVTPLDAVIMPNFEYNERQVAVIFGEFGNRLRPDQPGAIYPTKVEIVADETPLMLVGPKGPVSAVGLSKDSTNPYVSGPSLVGAKLNRMSTLGEGGPKGIPGPFPNDGIALYGAAAKFRLRLYTSGGFSPDGVRGLRPDEFEHFFRVHVTAKDGREMVLEKTGVDYATGDGVIRVLGLADLGLKASVDKSGKPVVAYDDCYVEDWDNYIDIILDGDEAAMRGIKAVEIPATGAYGAFYNPGGPGNSPTPGTVYTAPGAPDLEPVIMALDDPMTVSYGAD